VTEELVPAAVTAVATRADLGRIVATAVVVGR
jgi:hypothetical protein